MTLVVKCKSIGDSIIKPSVTQSLSQFLVSIVVSIPACHAGDRGSIPRRGDSFLIFSITCMCSYQSDQIFDVYFKRIGQTLWKEFKIFSDFIERWKVQSEVETRGREDNCEKKYVSRERNKMLRAKRIKWFLEYYDFFFF